MTQNSPAPTDDVLGWYRVEYPEAGVHESGIGQITIEPKYPTPPREIRTPRGWQIAEEGREFDGEPVLYIVEQE